VSDETITSYFDVELIASASVDDGNGTVEQHHVIITVGTQAVDASIAPSFDETQREITYWISRYLEGRDWTRALSFPPTPANVALYLLRAFRALDPSINSVTVDYDGDTGARAEAQ
jgi:hypothetical protein